MKYFLVEADGRETLAAYADESTPGDSHYTYKNCEEFTSFGTLCCHNRKALHSWLDSIRAGVERGGDDGTDFDGGGEE